MSRFTRDTHIMLEQRRPIGLRKPFVMLDITHTILQIAISIGYIDLNDMLQQVA
jgi:hypothetical protein